MHKVSSTVNKPSNVHQENNIEAPGSAVATHSLGTIMIGNIELTDFLRDHRDVFAWSHEDMPDIDPKVIIHHLNIDPSFCPVKQKQRTFNAERYMAINTKVDKLLKADFIWEANYPDWIANVVLVKKTNGNWRVCVDFTDLNKVCPKDIFPLPRIDQLVDATAGHELLSFMDPSPNSLWHLYVDRSSTDNYSRAGIILVSPEGVRLSCALRFHFKVTNNQVEYEAILAGLRLAKEVSAHHLLIYSDSQLIVN
ncbi:hypothetical protein UlMin_028330 [Ulmus minor]